MAASSEREFIPLGIAVLTITDTRTEETDKSGKLLVDRLESTGHVKREKVIVPDDIYQIRAVVSRWIATQDVQVVLTTGGTGVTGRDGTPEAVQPLLDKEIGGFGEMFRMLSYEDIDTSTLQSRCLAGGRQCDVYFFSTRAPPAPVRWAGTSSLPSNSTTGLDRVISWNSCPDCWRSEPPRLANGQAPHQPLRRLSRACVFWRRHGAASAGVVRQRR